MSAISTVISRLLNVRPIEPADLPRLLLIEKQRLGNRRIQPESPICLPSGDRGIAVAAIQTVVVGYLVYQVNPTSADEEVEPKAVRRKAALAQKPKALDTAVVALQQLYVAPEWRRRGVGRALVQRFDPKLHSPDGFLVQTVVPETNLEIQLLLRAAGFRATRVLRGHFAEEDGYLMEQHRS
jgi:ribosomal protein S18 acetylase RimI-like enzyme